MVGLLAFNSKGSGPYSHGAAGATYRFSFGCIAVLVLWMAYYRTWRMKPAKSPDTEPLKVEAANDAKQGRKVRPLRCSVLAAVLWVTDAVVPSCEKLSCVCAVLCRAVLRCAVLCRAVPCRAVLCCAVPCCAALCCDVPRCAVLCRLFHAAGC